MDNRIEIRPKRIINVVLYPHPSNTTTVFMIHGLGARGEQWRKQIEFLKDKYTLIIPDLLGHGKSDKPNSKTRNLYSFDEFSQDLKALFNQYSSHDNILIGHSYGGALAANLANHYQHRISKMILISPLPCSPTNKFPAIYHLPCFMLEWLRPLLEKQFYRLAFDATATPTFITEEITASRTNPMYMLKSMIMGMRDIPTFDPTKLNVATLILLGEHDQVVPPLASQQFYQALPHHEFNMIKQAAHMAPLEKYEQTNIFIDRFLHSQ